MRALTIRRPPLDLIMEGKKTWEMRGSRTKIREWIGLVPSGSGTIIGVCKLVHCEGPLTAEEYQENAEKAGKAPGTAKLGHYRQTYACVLEKPFLLKHSVPYRHPVGAVIWVKLDGEVERQILEQLPTSYLDEIVPVGAADVL